MDKLRRFARQRNSQDHASVGEYAQMGTSQNGNYQVGPTSASAPSIEGFICPSCRSSFVAMDDLISHAPNCTGQPFDGEQNVPNGNSSQNGNSLNDELTLKINGYDAMKEGNELLRQELQSSHKQQQSLNESLEKVSIENDALRKKTAEQERQLGILKQSFEDKQFDKLAAERSANKNQMDVLHKSVSILEEQKKSLERAISDKEKLFSDQQANMYQETATLKANLEAKIHSEKSLKQAMDAANAVQLSFTEEINRLRSELKSQKSSNDAIQSHSSDLEMEKKSLQSAMDRKDVELQKKVAEIAENAKERLQLTSSSSSINERVIELESRLKSETEKNSELAVSCNQLKKELDDKLNVVSTAEKELSKVVGISQKQSDELENSRQKLIEEIDKRKRLETFNAELANEKNNLVEKSAALQLLMDDELAKTAKIRLQLNEMTSKIQGGDEATTLLISQLRTDKEALEKAMADRERRNEEELKSEREARDQAVILIAELQTNCETLKNDYKDLLMSTSTSAATAAKEINSLQAEMLKMGDRSTILSEEKAVLLEQVAAKETEMKSLSEQLETRSSQMTELALRVSQLETVKVELEQKLIGSEMESKEIAGQVGRLLLEKESLQQGKTELKMQIVALQDQQEDLTTRLSAADQKNEELTKRNGELQNQIAGRESAILELREQISGLELKIGDLEKLIAEKNSAAELLSADTVVIRKGIEEAESTLKSVSVERDNAVTEKSKLENMLTGLRAELESVTARSEQALENLIRTEEMVQKMETEKTVLNSNIKEAEQKASTVSQALSEDIRLKSAEAESLRQSLATVQQEKDAEIAALSHQLTAARDSESALQNQLGSTNERLQAAENRSTDLQSHLKRELDQKGTLQDGLLRLTEAKELAESRAEELNRTLTEKDGVLRSVQAEFASISERLASSDGDIRRLNDDKILLEHQMGAMKENFERSTNELQLSLSTLTKRGGDLEERLATSAKTTQRIMEDGERMNSELSELRGKLEKKDGELKDIGTENTRLAQELKTREQRTIIEREGYLANLDESNLLIEKLQTRIVENDGVRETVERNLHQLQVEKNMTGGKVKELEEEKRVALNRVIELDDQKEKLQTSVGEMRRKYEDSLAALHELGREHQSLQVECSRLKSRRWAGDEAAVDCSACGKPFGLTQRKHHCRSCGEIFCQECSAKSANLVGSKKPARVCDSCFVEIQNRM